MKLTTNKKLNLFGKKLSHYLTIKGWTQQHLANKLDTSQQSISRWISGVTEPNLDDVLLISFFLNEDPDELLGYNDISTDEFKKFDSMFKHDK